MQHAELGSAAEPMAVDASGPPPITTAAAAGPETAQPSALPPATSSVEAASSPAAVSATPAQPSAFPAASNPSTQAMTSSQTHPGMQPARAHTNAATSAPAFQMGVSSQATKNEPGSSTAPDASRGQSGATVAGVDRPLHVFQRRQAILDAPSDAM